MAKPKYWTAVHAIQKQTGCTSAEARGAWRTLRDRYETVSTRTVREHPIIVNRAVAAERVEEVEEEEEEPSGYEPLDSYADLDDWLNDYDYFDSDDVSEAVGGLDYKKGKS